MVQQRRGPRRRATNLLRQFVPVQLVVVMLISTILFALSAPPARAEQPRVYAIRIDGVISQLTADHVVRILNKAHDEGASALVLQIRSPGGGEAAIRTINQAFLASPVPVIVFVGPDPEYHALSGAMFITMAAHVAGMAPDSTIGAPLPASLAGRVDQPEREERIGRALQIATTSAEARGRDVAAVTRAIEEEQLLTASEALESGLIDQISLDIETLLDAVDGRDVSMLIGAVTLSTENARVIWMSMTWRERALQQITDPNIAYVLFSIGIMLLLIQLYNPGYVLPGIPGVIALGTAFIAFGNLPVSWLGLTLMIGAPVLFIRELYTPRLGILGPLGIVSFVAGSLALYRPVRQTSAIAAAVGVDLWVITGITLLMAAVLLLIMRSIFRVRQDETFADTQHLVDNEGIVIQPLEPRGVVRVLGQEWSAMTDDAPIEEGAHIRVVDVRGGVLRVEPYAVELNTGSTADAAERR